MNIEMFVRRVAGFSSLGPTDQIRLFGWYVIRHCSTDRFRTTEIAKCFDEAHIARPTNLAQLIAKLVGRDLIKDARGLRLERTLLDKFDANYGERDETVEVERLLSELPSKLQSAAEKEYLEEALRCFRVKAYRAAIVMTWNVAYDHLVELIVDRHLAAFNAAIVSASVGKQAAAANRDDFQKWKESNVVKVAYQAQLFSKQVNKVLEDRLEKRNSAAHPSGAVVTKMNAEDYISDLVNNALLKLV